MAFGELTTNTSAFITGVEISAKLYIYNKIEKLENYRLHKDAVFLFFQASQYKDTHSLITKKAKDNILNNREVVKRIIYIIIFLAKQGLAFRGHRNETFKDFCNDDDSTNSGNFLALVRLVLKYDPILTKHIGKCTSNDKLLRLNDQNEKMRGRGAFVTFLSKTFVNKIINIIGEQFQNKIAENVNEAGIFSIKVDSTQDVSVKYKLSICVRYVYLMVIERKII